MRKINQFVKVKMWFWMKISLFQSLGKILRSSPRQKQHFHASQRQSSQGKKGSWTLQQPRTFEKKLKLYTLGGQLNPSATSNIWKEVEIVYVGMADLRNFTEISDRWMIQKTIFQGNMWKVRIFRIFWSNLQGVDVGDDWKIRFFKEVFLVGDMICLARGNFCNEKPAASLATAHKCFKKKTPCRFIGDTRPPCQCQRLITSAAPPKKKTRKCRWVSQGYVRKRAYCELCDELALPRKPHRCSFRREPWGATGGPWCAIHWD